MARQSRSGAGGHKRGKRGAPQTFAWKLYSILDSESPIVGWSPAGDSFTVHNDKDFALHILTKNYRHGKFSSFQRQLNMYGFRKVADCSDRTYAHPFFRRDRPELLTKVRRVNPGHKLKKPASDAGGVTDTAAVGAERVERDDNDDDDGFGAETTGESEEGDEEAPAARKKWRPKRSISGGKTSGKEDGDDDANGDDNTNDGEVVPSGEESRLKLLTSGVVETKLQASGNAGSGNASGVAQIPELEPARVPKRRQVKVAAERQTKAAKMETAVVAAPDAARSRQEEVVREQRCSADARPPMPAMLAMPAMPPISPKQRIRRQLQARPRQPGLPSGDFAGPYAVSSAATPSHVYPIPSPPPLGMSASPSQQTVGFGSGSMSNSSTAAGSVAGTGARTGAVESIPWRGSEVVSPGATSSVGSHRQVGDLKGNVRDGRVSSSASPVDINRASDLYCATWSDPIASIASIASDERGCARENGSIDRSSAWLDRALGFGVALAQSPAAARDLILDPNDFAADEGAETNAAVTIARAVPQVRPCARVGVDAGGAADSRFSPAGSAALVTPPSASDRGGSVTTSPWDPVDTTNAQLHRETTTNNSATSSFEHWGQSHGGRCSKTVFDMGLTAMVERVTGNTRNPDGLDRPGAVMWAQPMSTGEEDDFQAEDNSAAPSWTQALLTGCYDTSSIDWALAEGVEQEDVFLKAVEGLGDNGAGASGSTCAEGLGDDVFGSLPDVAGTRAYDDLPHPTSAMMTSRAAPPISLSLPTYLSEPTPSVATLPSPRPLGHVSTCGGNGAPNLSMSTGDPSLSSVSESWGLEAVDSRVPLFS